MRGKTVNQQRVLQRHDRASPHLAFALENNYLDESDCARRYWQLSFPTIGWVSTKRERREDSPPNQMLNYGYAVLSALCHRSLVIHGLSPQIGVKHTTRYKADPLVYDLMEPFRPAVDLMLAEFMVGADISFKAWARKIGNELKDRRVHHERYSLKIMDAIDASASSMAQAVMPKTQPNRSGSRLSSKTAFRMGWVLVMFDLPVLTDDERRTATHFRKQLIDSATS